MKVRTAGESDAKVEMQMTPMIDVVFQLLTFFIMSFKVALPEGDFNIRMPVGGVGDQPPSSLSVVMRSNADGGLSSLVFEGEELFAGQVDVCYERLHARVLTLAQNLGGPETLTEPPTVRVDCDYGLRYEFVIRTVTEVSGHREDSGRVLRLFDKVDFARPKQQG
jgi:biopolymer transport protein ExbD